MNTYNIDFNETLLELPKYSVAIAKKLEKLENSGASDVETKLKLLYNFIQEIVGKDKTEEIIGTFQNADPSDINIVYLKIANEYQRPLEEYEAELSLRLLDDPRLTGAINQLDKVSKWKREGLKND